MRSTHTRMAHGLPRELRWCARSAPRWRSRSCDTVTHDSEAAKVSASATSSWRRQSVHDCRRNLDKSNLCDASFPPPQNVTMTSIFCKFAVLQLSERFALYLHRVISGELHMSKNRISHACSLASIAGVMLASVSLSGL